MTANSIGKIGGILLAAGGSSRLGHPKQLLEFRGKTLIRRAAETLVNSRCGPIVVVLGAEIERSTAELNGLEVSICINENWQTGMSSSIISGLNSLLKIEPKLNAVLITLCDQPHITSADIDRIIECYKHSGAEIAAAQYGETTGVPAVFSKGIFDQLFRLDGDKGARALISGHESLVTVQLDHAAHDIDTLEDLVAADSL